MKRSPSPAEIKYLRHQAEREHRGVKVAIAQRLGATVIKRRTMKWNIAVAKLEAALAKVERRAA